MSDSHWKDALWNLLHALSLRRLTARVALSASLVGLATQSTAEAGAQPRVPVTPAFTPEVTVRKFKGKYVLRRMAGTLGIHLAGHRSHSSHSSHRSHASHSSGSHYSGSHFSSSPSPPTPPAVPEPAPAPRRVVQEPPAPPPKPAPVLQEDFATAELTERWNIGVLATPPSTFDPAMAVEVARGFLSITPAARKDGAHFSGCVSRGTFDLRKASITAQLRRASAGGTTLFVAAVDHANWIGFRVEGGRLVSESHTEGKVASHATAFDPEEHRFLRLRMTDVVHIIVWETSADGIRWNAEYVETGSIALDALRIALSAGTTKRVDTPGAAAFEGITVEQAP
jgi:hypothetical protein